MRCLRKAESSKCGDGEYIWINRRRGRNSHQQEEEEHLYTQQIPGLRSRKFSFLRQLESTGEHWASFPLGNAHSPPALSLSSPVTQESPLHGIPELPWLCVLILQCLYKVMALLTKGTIRGKKAPATHTASVSVLSPTVKGLWQYL